VPRRSGLTLASVVPPSVFNELQHDAAQTLWDALINCPSELAHIAPMGNFPRPEVLFNTKIAFTFSRLGRKALAAPQGLQRVCTGCCSTMADSTCAGFSRGAQCAEGGCKCNGCDSCVGRQFLCPLCGCSFHRLWVYETGSAKGSICRAADRALVMPFTAAQEAAAARLDMAASAKAVASGGPNPPLLRSCVLVSYLGSEFCAACALDLPHGSKQCGSVLHAHKDRAGGENSQSASPNYTLNVGAPRQLSMEMRVLYDNGSAVRDGGPGSAADAFQTGVGANAEVQFNLTHGSQFNLEPEDEELLARDVGDGSIGLGSFYHGMEKEIAPRTVSCGLVFRNVTGSAEVNILTNHVIMRLEQRQEFQTRLLRRGLSNPPTWARGFKGTRAAALAMSRSWWATQAPVYSNKIRGLLADALAQWTDATVATAATDATADVDDEMDMDAAVVAVAAEAANQRRSGLVEDTQHTHATPATPATRTHDMHTRHAHATCKGRHMCICLRQQQHLLTHTIYTCRRRQLRHGAPQRTPWSWPLGPSLNGRRMVHPWAARCTSLGCCVQMATESHRSIRTCGSATLHTFGAC